VSSEPGGCLVDLPGESDDQTVSFLLVVDIGGALPEKQTAKREQASIPEARNVLEMPVKDYS